MEYIKSIVLFLVFVAFVENILISEQAKKYLKLFCGIVLIFLTLQWVGSILGKELNIDELIGGYDRNIDLNEINSVLDNKEGDRVEEDISNIVALEGYKLDNIQVQTDEKGELELLYVYVTKTNENIYIDKINLGGKKTDEKSVGALKICDKIAEKFDIDKSDIEVIVN